MTTGAVALTMGRIDIGMPGARGEATMRTETADGMAVIDGGVTTKETAEIAVPGTIDLPRQTERMAEGARRSGSP